jgi:hypothetical protein
MTRINTLSIFLFFSLASQSGWATECVPPPLSDQAKAILKPLMALRNRQASEQFFDDGRWRGESSVTDEVEKRVYTILEDHSKAGDEAVAYLLTVYLGEHPGEELACEATNRGKIILPLVRAYHRCQPSVGAEPLHRFVRGSGVLAEKVIGAISNGSACEPEE